MENKIQFCSLFIILFTVFGLVFAGFFCTDNKLFATTSTDTIYISTAQELTNFAALINDKETYEIYANARLELTTDIDLSGTNFTPIGKNSNEFMGTFLGNNHMISGLKLADNALNGLFGAIENAQISDLIIKSEAMPSTSSGTKYYGGLTGLVNGGKIDNCAFYFEINGDFSTNNTYLGGIIGRNSSNENSPVIVSNCVAYITGDFSINERSYFDAIFNMSSNAEIYNSIIYCDTNKLQPHNTTSPNLNNTIITNNNDIADYSNTLGSNFIYCIQCNKMELVSNVCKVSTTTEITPQLNITEYIYSATIPELQFAEINKVDVNDDVYFKYTVSGINAGTQTAYLSLHGTDADKYALTITEITFQILPRPIEIEIHSTNSIYGDNIKNIDYNIKNAISSDNIEISFDFINEIQNTLYNAGEYKIIPKTDNSNYKISAYSEATYTITKRPVTIINTEFTKTFDNKTFIPVIELSNILEKDKTATMYTFLDELPVNFGNYIAKIALNNELTKNYELTSNEINLSITQRNIELVWQKDNFIFNNSIQHPIANLQLDIDYTMPEIFYTGGGSTAGKHSITAYINNKNLKLTNATHSYEIMPFSLTVQWSNNRSLIFNGNKQNISFSYFLPFNYKIDYSLNGGGSDAGTYTAQIVTQDTNINIQNSECNFTIEPLTVEVFWTNTITTFNNTPQSPNYLIKHSLNYEFLTTDNFNFINAGTYTAEIQTADKNIKLLHNTTNFVIKPYQIAINFENTTQTFNNSTLLPKVKYNAPDFDPELQITLNGGARDVGTYTVSAILNDENYELITPTCTFTILPYTLTLDWEQTTHIFDNQMFLPNAHYTLTFDYEPKIQYLGSAINAGNYTATAKTNDKNIILENASIDFEILPRKIALIWGETEYQYTGYIIKPEYSYTSFDYNFEITLDASNADVGTYLVTALCTNENISLSNNTFTYSIYPRDCTVIWNDSTLYYNGQTQAPSFSLEYDSTNLNPTCLPVVYVTGGALNIGSYTATARIDSKNFNLLNTKYNFEILANSVESSDFPLEIKGEILGTTHIDVKTVNDIAQNIPTGYSLIFAINIMAENGLHNNGNMQIEMALMPNLNSGFKILKFDNDFTEINYTVSEGRIIFDTTELGTFCFVITATPVSNLLPYAIPCAAVLIIAIIAIIVIHHRKHKVIFRAH